MDGFTLGTCLIPELRINKINFRILKYKNGDPESLMVYCKCNGICRVDTKSVIGSTDCYNVVWYTTAPSLLHLNGRILDSKDCFSTGYARAVDLVHDIRKVIDFNFKEGNEGENKMNKKIYKVSDISYESNPWQMDEITFTVNVLVSHHAEREDCERIKDAIESAGVEQIYGVRRNSGRYTWRNEYQKERDKFEIKDVIFNDPATIVLWADGTKTVVKAENEPFDPEKGLAMAISKRALGDKYNYYDTFKKYVGRYEKKQKKGDK